MQNVGIFAGNPKVGIYRNEVIVEDAQIIAFQKAIELAVSFQDQVRRVAVAFDHAKKFGDQFLDPAQSIPKRKWKRLTLSQLHPVIRNEYEEVLSEHGMRPEDISVFTEDYLRLAILENTDNRQVVRPAMPSEVLCFDGMCDEQKERYRTYRKPKVNCRGVTAAIIEKVSRGCDEAYAFWEHDPVRVKEEVIDEGTQLAYEIFSIRSRIVSTMFFDQSLKRIEYAFDAQNDTVSRNEGRHELLQ